MAVRPWTVRQRYRTTCFAPASHPYVFAQFRSSHPVLHFKRSRRDSFTPAIAAEGGTGSWAEFISRRKQSCRAAAASHTRMLLPMPSLV